VEMFSKKTAARAVNRSRSLSVFVDAATKTTTTQRTPGDPHATRCRTNPSSARLPTA
jgi:hypothetical protein